ncbi:hypothetical protein C5167_037615 [Papaver somniferum]|uniref:AB hydrolase-1 domain-containing protein n=1 Tax=Papaver somniferum TaxID=3469 RepID=A0A4Y7I9F3_PAPSO|nr:salicylic acid-binding protein 2-like [Papaver somniferum]RZC44676.1 hypothetical protein C5167_037615 [Papaver somniferum]
MATNSAGSTKKHFALVHGACHGAWSWYKLTPLLKSAGHRVTVLDMAGAGINPKQVTDVQSFSDYVQPLMDFMEHSLPSCESIKQEEKVILVGHSMGGLVISKAMETFPEKISVAVFLTALLPNMLQEFKFPDVFKERSRGDAIYNYYDEGAKTFVFGPSYMSSNLYELCSPEDATLATMLVRPIRVFSNEHMSEEITTSKQKYGSIKRVYIIAELDKTLTRDFPCRTIEKDPVDEVREIIGSDHMVMMSKPQELFACLKEIAEEA